MATSKKAGPPVPPRPTPTGLFKSQSESSNMKNSIAIKSSATTTNSITQKNASASGRTVIYKSPSFDNKKRQQLQQQQQQQHQQQQHQYHQSEKDNNNKISQRIKVSPLKNNNNNNNKNVLELNNSEKLITPATPATPATKTTTTHIYTNINGNNKNNLNDSSFKIAVSQTSPPIPPNRSIEMRRNRTEIFIRNNNQRNDNNHLYFNDNLENQLNHNQIVPKIISSSTPIQLSTTTTPKTTTTNQVLMNLNNFNKLDRNYIDNNDDNHFKSPIPKPRTLITTSKINNQYNHLNNQLINDNNNNNNNNNQRIIYRSHSTLCSISKSTPIIIKNIDIDNDRNNVNNICNIKNIEIENNLKNVAERLFTEIIINQTQQNNNNNKISNDDAIKISSLQLNNNINNNKNNNHNDEHLIEKTEHCISVRSTPSPPSSIKLQQKTFVNLSQRPEPEGECEIYKIKEQKHFLPSNKKIILPAINGTGGTGGTGGSNGGTCNYVEKKVAFHEILIDELAAMRQKTEKTLKIDHDLSDSQSDEKKPIYENDNIDNDNIDNDDDIYLKKHLRKRYPSGCSTDSSPYGTQRSNTSSSRIRTSDWIEVGDNGKKVMLTSCNISLEDSGLEDEIERLEDYSSGVGDSWDSVKDNSKRMSLPGLPPLPKSLSGIDNFNHHDDLQINFDNNNQTNDNDNLDNKNFQKTSKGLKSSTTLDNQLAILRREMFGLRQLDLTLLSQLWALNESIQEFRTLLQENDTLSPPSPTPSDINSVSSDGEDEQEIILPEPITLSPSKVKLNQEQQYQQSSLNVKQHKQPIQQKQQQQQQQQQQHRMRGAPPPPPSRKAPQRPNK